MSVQEIKSRIDELETKQFYLNMKDRWSGMDYTLDCRYTNEIRNLKKLLDK